MNEGSGAIRQASRQCRTTFSICMKTAVHCMNELGANADDPCVSALMECAECCYSVMNFTDHASRAQAQALDRCAEACARAVRLCEGLGDPAIENCIRQCKECERVCNSLPLDIFSEAG